MGNRTLFDSLSLCDSFRFPLLIMYHVLLSFCFSSVIHHVIFLGESLLLRHESQYHSQAIHSQKKKKHKTPEAISPRITASSRHFLPFFFGVAVRSLFCSSFEPQGVRSQNSRQSPHLANSSPARLITFTFLILNSYPQCIIAFPPVTFIYIVTKSFLPFLSVPLFFLSGLPSQTRLSQAPHGRGSQAPQMRFPKHLKRGFLKRLRGFSSTSDEISQASHPCLSRISSLTTYSLFF